MKHYKQQDVPATTTKVLDRTTCDLCGDDITNHPHNIDEVEITRREGSHYPGTGSGETTRVDMCGQCFEGKLAPWLISQGAVVTTEEYDF